VDLSLQSVGASGGDGSVSALFSPDGGVDPLTGDLLGGSNTGQSYAAPPTIDNPIFDSTVISGLGTYVPPPPPAPVAQSIWAEQYQHSGECWRQLRIGSRGSRFGRDCKGGGQQSESSSTCIGRRYFADQARLRSPRGGHHWRKRDSSNGQHRYQYRCYRWLRSAGHHRSRARFPGE
jgi:hypothetical protein